jgi:hypothetical protein
MLNSFLVQRSLRLGGLAAVAFGGALIQAPAAFAVPPAGTPGTDPTAGISRFAVQNTAANVTFNLTNNTFGYGFTTSRAIVLTSLGVLDIDSDGAVGTGLKQSHQVGIWEQDTQTLLGGGTVTVQAGTSSTLVNGFRYQGLASKITLKANTSYRIGAVYDYAVGNNDYFAECFSGVCDYAAAGGIALGLPYLSAGATSGFAYPNDPENVFPGYFGPNFQYEEVPGPLPLFGAATAFGFSRRLRNRIRSNSSLG